MKYIFYLLAIFLLTGIGFFLNGSSGALIAFVVGCSVIILRKVFKSLAWSMREMGIGDTLGAILIGAGIIWLIYYLIKSGWSEVFGFIIILILFGIIGSISYVYQEEKKKNLKK